MAISLSNRSCPCDFNASIDCWLKTTSHYDVIAPSTVSTTQNAKLLPSPTGAILWCFVMSQDHSAWGSVKHFGDPPVLVEPSRLRRNRRSSRKQDCFQKEARVCVSNAFVLEDSRFKRCFWLWKMSKWQRKQICWCEYCHDSGSVERHVGWGYCSVKCLRKQCCDKSLWTHCGLVTPYVDMNLGRHLFT